MIGGKNCAQVRQIINKQRFERETHLTRSSSAPDGNEMRPRKMVHQTSSPMRRNTLPTSQVLRELMDDAFLIEESTIQEIPADRLERVFLNYSQGDDFLDDGQLEILLVEILILARQSALRQIQRQQMAVRHCTQKHGPQRQDTGIPDIGGLNESGVQKEAKDHEADFIETVHDKFPAVGQKELPVEAGKTAVKCNQILSQIHRGSRILNLKEILTTDSEEHVHKRHFVQNFPTLLYTLCSETNLIQVSQLAPIRHASSGVNLNWRPNALPVGPVQVKCEFEFEDIEGVPDEEVFNVPHNTNVADFVTHLCLIYAQIDSSKEDIEIQIITAESITCVDFDSDFVLFNGVELVLMD